jgi:(2R)-sulfolactate sulfo-lyase subunit alpha
MTDLIRPSPNRHNRKSGAAPTVSIPQLLVHDRRDNVGVVVVEDLAAGTEMLCVVTQDNSDFRLRVGQDVPIGHKVALADLAAGTTVIKYGQDIGRIVAAVRRGEHVHVHNLKTKRW